MSESCFTLPSPEHTPGTISVPAICGGRRKGEVRDGGRAPAVRGYQTCSKKDAKVCVRIQGSGGRRTVSTVTTWGAMTQRDPGAEGASWSNSRSPSW